MRPIWASAATPEDSEQASVLLTSTEQNLIDVGVLAYPATEVLKASDGEKNIVFMPVQTCQVWESLGVNPEASEMEVAAGLKALAHVLRFKALANGQREIMFLCAEPSTQRFAEHHGFEKLDIPLYRMRIK